VILANLGFVVFRSAEDAKCSCSGRPGFGLLICAGDDARCNDLLASIVPGNAEDDFVDAAEAGTWPVCNDVHGHLQIRTTAQPTRLEGSLADDKGTVARWSNETDVGCWSDRALVRDNSDKR
jgi:hypothetical protein